MTIYLSRRDIAVSHERYAALQRLSESAALVPACFRSSPERRLTPADLKEETAMVRRRCPRETMRAASRGHSAARSR